MVSDTQIDADPELSAVPLSPGAVAKILLLTVITA
jgi:hypothetical protein